MILAAFDFIVGIPSEKTRTLEIQLKALDSVIEKIGL